MSALIVTAVESLEQAKQPHWMQRMYVTPQKFMSVFMKKLSLRELFIQYLRIFCFPTIEDTGNSCFCIRQGISVVMSDNIVLNANFLISKLRTFNLYSDLQEGEVVYGKYVCA